MWDAVRKFFRQDEAPEEAAATGDPATRREMMDDVSGPEPPVMPTGPERAAPPVTTALARQAPAAPAGEPVEASPPDHAPQGLAAETAPAADAVHVRLPDDAGIMPTAAPDSTTAAPETAPVSDAAESIATTSAPALDTTVDEATAAAAPTVQASAGDTRPVAGEDTVPAVPSQPTEPTFDTATAGETLPDTATSVSSTGQGTPPEITATATPDASSKNAATAIPEAPTAVEATAMPETPPSPSAADMPDAADTQAANEPMARTSDGGATAGVAPAETPGESNNVIAAEASPAVSGAGTVEAEPAEETTAQAEPVGAAETLEIEAPAEPAALEPLAAGTLVGGRYAITALDENAAQSGDRLVYHATDTHSYEQCWSCGSAENAPTTRFCQNCGAPIQDHPVTLVQTREAFGEPGEIAYEGAYFHVQRERRRFGAEGVGIEVGAYSAEGPHHPNEDSYWYVTRTLCANSGRRSVGIVVFADGMGGYAPGSGLISGRIAATTGRHLFDAVAAPEADGTAPDALDEAAAEAMLRDAIAAANAMVLAEIARKGEMGATLVAALVYGDTAYLANIGDSRAYYVDPSGRATAITRDQSLVAQEVAQGHLEEGDVYTAIGNNIILHAVGEENVQEAADCYAQPLEPGSYLLLCSDGYWKTLHGAVMPEGTLDGCATLGQAAHRMVDDALTQGSDDNTTVVLVAIS